MTWNQFSRHYGDDTTFVIIAVCFSLECDLIRDLNSDISFMKHI